MRHFETTMGFETRRLRIRLPGYRLIEACVRERWKARWKIEGKNVK